jgi:hypothetical protein
VLTCSALFVGLLLIRFGVWRADAAPARAAGPGTAAVQPLPNPAGEGSAEPDLSTGPDGVVWASWLERADSTHRVLRVARLDGSRWSAPLTVASGDSFLVNGADTPRILALGAGRLVVSWPWLVPGGEASDEDPYQVRFAASRDSGRTWSAPRVPHADRSATEHGFVSLVPERGGARLVWLDGRANAGGEPGAGSGTQLRTAWLAASGTLTPDSLLDPRVCDCCHTSVAMAAGGPIVAFRDRTDDDVRDTGVLRRVAGAWRPAVGVPRPHWKIAGCPVNGPSIAARGARVALAWYAAPGDSARVGASFSTDGGATFGGAIRVDDGDPAGRLATALLPDGALAVAWVERTAAGAGSVRVRIVRASGSRAASVEVAGIPSPRAGGVPRMAFAGGRLVVAWTDGAPARVRTATLAPTL